jgi:hypothetical protein
VVCVFVEGGCDRWGFEVGFGLGKGGEEGREGGEGRRDGGRELLAQLLWVPLMLWTHATSAP